VTLSEPAISDDVSNSIGQSISIERRFQNALAVDPKHMTLAPILIVHVATGVIAVLAGGVALFAAKGSQPHRVAGCLFVASMLGTSIAGGIVAYSMPEQLIALLGGVLACYLVVTALLTVRPRSSKIVVAEVGAFLFVLATGAYLVSLGTDALTSASGLRSGYSAEPYFFLGAVCVLAGGLDAVVLRRGGTEGRQRLARHLWRMSFGYFIAAGSLSTGPGSRTFPEAIKQTGILSAPEPIILLLMGYWLLQILWGKQTPPTRSSR
jgi:uncharacterized membrane protein